MNLWQNLFVPVPEFEDLEGSISNSRRRLILQIRKELTIYRYEEGVKRILAKQIQQILERDKQPNLTPAIAQSSFQWNQFP